MVDRLHPDVQNAPHATAPDRPAAGAPAAVREDVTRPGAPLGFGYTVEAVPIHPQGRGTIVILRMAGEIDLLTQPAVQTALHSGLQAGALHLLVDLSAVSFCGARGLSTLADATSTAAGRRIGYAVSGLSPHLSRVATTLWEPHRPPRYRSLAAAVTAIRATHARRG